MKTRKLLITIISIVILGIYPLVAYFSYKSGEKKGERNTQVIYNLVLNKLVEEGKISNEARYEISKRIEKQENSDSLNIKSVSVIKVNNANLQSEISSDGFVVSRNNMIVLSEVSGQLESNFSIKKGIKFRKGDVLFKIKNKDVKLLADAKKINFMSLISSNLADIKLDFPSEYKKWETFFNSISLNSSIGDLPKPATTKEKNFMLIKLITEGYYAIKSDEEKLKKYTMHAPFDGVIVESYTEKGAKVNMGSPVIHIIDNRDMEVELGVNSTEFNFIEIGNRVTLTNGEDSLYGIIIRKLDNVVNKNTQNMSVFASISNEDMLHDNMYLNAIISGKTINNVCKIPRRAVFSKNKIFIINSENKLEIMKINIISREENSVVIDNISNNTMVVNEPLIDTKAGTTVKPIIK